VEIQTSCDTPSHTPIATSQALLDGTVPTHVCEGTQVCLFSDYYHIYIYTRLYIFYACRHAEFIAYQYLFFSIGQG